MSNAIPWPEAKSLKNGLCGFCDYVRAHEREAMVARGQGPGRERLLHNNNNNYIIYINEIAGGSVARGGIA